VDGPPAREPGGDGATVPAPVEKGTGAAGSTAVEDEAQAELEGGAGDGDAIEDGADVKDPLRFNNWRRRSAAGAVMTGIAVGLQQALELPRQQPAFVIEASGEPEDPDRPIDLHFDPDSPADTVAIIRRRAPVDPPPEEPSASP